MAIGALTSFIEGSSLSNVILTITGDIIRGSSLNSSFCLEIISSEVLTNFLSALIFSPRFNLRGILPNPAT